MTDFWINPDWPAAPGIKAVSTLRTGGVSRDVFASLNLGDHVGDEPAHVHANRQKLKQQLNLPSEPVWLKQVHGVQVIDASVTRIGSTADAGYSRKAGIVCAVMTADCLPLLLSSKEGTVVAAVHCGWRSLLAGIIKQTLSTMASDACLAWMGPAIGAQAFTVGSEVRQLFIDKQAHYAQAFVPQGKGKWLADIYALARIDLAVNGVTQVYGGDRCTYSETEQFFSYRRQGQTGRMATLIWREV